MKLAGKLIVGTAVTVALASIIVVRMQARMTEPEPPAARVFAVRTETVDAASFEKRRSYTGTVLAVRRASLASRLAATVEEVTRREGEAVAEGELLVRLDDEELEHEIRRLRAAVRRTAADLAYWRERLEADRKLVREGTVTEQGYADTRRRVATLEASLDEARGALEAATTRQGYTRVTAPFAGRVQRIHQEPGEMAGVGAPLVEVVADTPLKGVFAVPQADLQELHEGQEARVRAGGGEWQTSVHRIYPALESGTRTGSIEVRFPQPAGASARPGMAAELDVPVARANRALAVPQHAILRRDGDEGVFVRDGDTARWRAVETGGVSGGRVRVTEGLSVGDEVVVTPYVALTDGSSITLETVVGEVRGTDR